MKYVNKEIRSGLVVAVLVIMISGFLTSCRDFIDPEAANSHSAILAVIGEYLYATIALFLVVVVWILRPSGIALVLLGILGVCEIVELAVNSMFLVCIGIMMFLTSFAPIKQYEPLVVISKHFKIPKKEKVREKHNGSHDFFIQLSVGIITLIIEYLIFAK